MNNKGENRIIPKNEVAKKALKVPDGYFESNSIQLKMIPNQEKPESRMKSLSPYLKWVGSAAATIALVLYFTLGNQQDIYELSSEEFYALFESGYINYTDEELAYLDLESDWTDFISTNELNPYSDDELIYIEDELFYEN